MKKKIKILGLTLCGVLALGAGSIAVTKLQNVDAATQLVLPQEYSLEEEYSYGQTLIVPEPEKVSIKMGGMVTTAVDVVLQFPDGSARGEGSYVLDKTGSYALTYYNANGASVTENFTVYKNAYSIGGNMPAEYVENLVGQENKSGIEVSLKDGVSFAYNRSINLNDYAGETLEVCKIFPMFKENADSAPSASTVSIKVVDCYDSSKFVEFYVWAAASNEVYYTGAGASTQGLTGLEYNPNRPHIMTESYEGTMYKIHRPSRYQSNAAWGAGLRARCNADLIQYDGITLLWDLSTQKTSARYSTGTTLITDLDSTEIYDANAMDFNSFFTTGEVYLEIQAYNYTTNTFEFGVETIFGMGGDALQDGRLIDKELPEISVDVEPTQGNTVYLQKGKAFTLPKIKDVFDVNYHGDVRVEIYRNYGKYGQTLASVMNGEFVPEQIGNYTAVYTATDAYGNEGKFLLNLLVLEEPNLIYQPIAVEKLVAAKTNIIPSIEVRGLNKAVSTSVVVTAPNGESEELEKTAENNYEYIPAYAGEYTVSYFFKDNVYEDSYSYSVSCVDENSATFKNPFTLPTALMKGASYTINPVTAYTAGAGAFNENAATVSVSVDGGAYQTLSAAQMQAYKVEANETLRFKASYGNSSVESDIYSVVDVGYGKKTSEKDYTRYMQGNYTESAMTLEGLKYDFNGDAELQFINAISGAKFKLNFTLQAEVVNSFTIVLRDLYNPNRNYVTYTYEMGTGENVVMHAKQYEDGKLVFDKTILTKYTQLAGTYALSYSVAGMDADGVVLSGIKPFAKDSTLLEMSVSGAESGCTVTVSKINAQNFTLSMRESKPQLIFTACDGVQEINAIYQVLPCYANSVLCSVLARDITISVYAPDGEIACDLNGNLLEKVHADKTYSLQLSQTGQYRVVYEVSCIGSSLKNGQETLAYDDYDIVNVSERIAPVISFKDGSNEQTTVHLAVGSTHKIKEFTVTDNLSSTENIKVYTMIYGKDMALEEDGYNVTSYVFKNVGEFLVYVVAYDELGNSSALYYNVVVS